MGFPKIRVLFVTTEPKGPARLDTTKELELLRGALQDGRASFHIDNVYHATRSSLMDALRDHKPEIVHFLVHGSLEGAFFENREGGKALVTAEWLTSVFERHPEVRLVVLNACMSAVSLARPLVDSARTRIRGCLGWSDRVLEADARSFAVDFYERIAAGDSIYAAFRSAIDESSDGFADQAHPVLALRGGADFRPGRWRAVHFAALGGIVALLGLTGIGLSSFFCPRPELEALLPRAPKSDLLLFPPKEDHRPMVWVHLEPKALDVLKRRPEPAPTPRPADPTRSDSTSSDSTRSDSTSSDSTAPDTRAGAALTHAATVTRDPTVATPRPAARRPDDRTSARTIEDRVTARLTEAIPLLHFQATAGDRAPPAGLTLQLSARAKKVGGRWPNSPVHLEAQLMLDGRVLTKKRLCTLTPGQLGEGDQLPLEQRFIGCEEAIAERIERWDDDIHQLFVGVPFKTQAHYDPATHYISTQLVHANIAATYDALSGTAVFALRHPDIGDLPFRACADERIGGYLTADPDRFEACHKLYDAAQAQVSKPETRADHIYLKTWRGGQ